MSRYFPATAVSGRLIPHGIQPWGPWDPGQLRYVSDETVEAALRSSDRKADTAVQLRRIMVESAKKSSTISVWVREGLEDEARTWWENRG